MRPELDAKQQIPQESDLNSVANGESFLRLGLHLKEPANQVKYLLGLIVAYKMGLLDKVFMYGSGLCG